MSLAFSVIAFTVFVVALAFAAFYGWHLWRIWLERRRHTRERFLFLAFRAIVAASLAYFGYLFAGIWNIQSLVSLASGTSIDLSAQPNQPDALSVVGATLVLLALLAFTYLAFRNWAGPPSEFERRNPKRATSELIIGLLADHDLRRLMLQPGQEPLPPSLAAAPPAPPGHLRAMTLIMAHDPHYQVRAEDWHPEEHAFLARKIHQELAGADQAAEIV
jgi:hypothetical protein